MSFVATDRSRTARRATLAEPAAGESWASVVANENASGWAPGGIRTEALVRWTADWAWWQAQPSAGAALRRWQSRHPCLAGLCSLAEVLAACGRAGGDPAPVADARLAAVVAEARGGDGVAARLALQRVLPALVLRATRRAAEARMPLGPLLEELLGAAWLIIVTFPLERRPAKIAVNIILDTEARVLRPPSVMWRRSVLTPPHRMPEQPADLDGSLLERRNPVVGQLWDELAWALDSGFPRADARLLAELYLLGIPVAEIAHRDGVSARTIRNRRRAALVRFADWLGVNQPDRPRSRAERAA